MELSGRVSELVEKGAYREDEIRHVTVASDDFEARDGVVVANNVRDLGRAVLLDPRDIVGDGGGGGRRRGSGGSHGVSPRASSSSLSLALEGQRATMGGRAKPLRREKMRAQTKDHKLVGFFF